MSAQATGWVFDKSPYKGALFTLHLAIADTVNDAYENELWAAVSTLADKARLGERIVRSGLGQMVDDGLLELMSARNGHVRRYRFLMPLDPCTSCTPAQDAPLHVVPKTPALSAGTPASGAQTPARRAPVSQLTQVDPKQEPKLSDFDEFWKAYPEHKAKGAARTAWAKAIKRADPFTIIAGAVAYRDDPDRKDGFTKHPATWLNADCWTDEPAVRRRTHAKGVTAAQRLLERHTGTELNR